MNRITPTGEQQLNSGISPPPYAYDDDMDPTVLVLASVALGIVLGIGATIAIVNARAAGKRRSAEMRPELPEIAVAILDEIEIFAVILDASLTAVYANPTARHEQHVSGERIREPEFLQRVRRVMSTGISDTHDPDPMDGLHGLVHHYELTMLSSRKNRRLIQVCTHVLHHQLSSHRHHRIESYA